MTFGFSLPFKKKKDPRAPMLRSKNEINMIILFFTDFIVAELTLEAVCDSDFALFFSF